MASLAGIRSSSLAAALTILLCGFPSSTEAQGKVHRIGILWDSPAVLPEALEALRKGLRDFGYVEGRNLAVEYRWAEGNPARMRDMAGELARLKVDVIIAPSSVYTAAAKSATTTIPIVFLSHADPVASGHVAQLARPGGNATGLTLMMTETNVKGMELFKAVVPRLSRLAVVWNPATPSHPPGLKAIEAAAEPLAIRIQSVPVRTAAEYESAFDSMVREHADGLVVLSTPLFLGSAQALAELALKHRLPSLFGAKHHVAAGGLMSYSTDRNDLYRRGAVFVDKILKGANPAELPVERATKFEFVLNATTARALGLEIPRATLVRVDEVLR